MAKWKTVWEEQEWEKIRLKKITPVKGRDYFDGKDGYTPIKGVDYFDGKDGYTPIKGVDYFDGKDGRNGLSIKGDKGDKGEPGKNGITTTKIVKEEIELPAEDIKKKLESLSGNNRLDASAIKNLPEKTSKNNSGVFYAGSVGNVSKTSELENDSGFLVSDDIAGKVDKAGDTMTGDLTFEDSKINVTEIKTDTVEPTDLSITTGAEKTIVLETIVWDDLRITPGSFDRPGVADPDYVAYYPNGGSLSCYLPEFAKNDFASFMVQLPHGYKIGGDLKVHVHWTAGARGNEESGNTVGWKIDYAWANINGAFPDMQTANLSDECTATDHVHQMTPEVTISGSAKSISSMLICNIRRSDTGTDDTWVGTASGSLPLLLEVDFHFPIDTVGSRTSSSK